MDFMRKTALVAAALFFSATLFGFVMLIGLQRTIGSTAEIKQAFRDSGIYKSVTRDILAEAEKEQDPKGQTDMDIPLGDARIRSIIDQSFSPAYLQTETEKVLDNAGAWLNGDIKNLSFTIDVQDAKIRLADGLSAYVKERAASLPPCTAANIPQGGSAEFNAFKAECLPPGTTPDVVATEARDQILQGEFLKDTRLSADSIKNEKGETLNQQLEGVPAAYQNLEQGVYVLGSFAVLFGASVVLLSVPKRAGFKRVAITTITVGVSTSLLGWLSSWALDKAATKLDSSEPLQQTMFDILRNLTTDVRMWWLRLGIALVVFGVIVLVVLHVKKPQAGKNDETPAAPKSNFDSSVPPTASTITKENPPEKPSKKPVNKKLVQ